MMPLTPCCLLAAARAMVGIREEGGNNRGTMVERFLALVDQKSGAPWCAAFVHYVGFWSHYNVYSRASAWPLPATASCYMLGEFARRERILVQQPQPADVFLVYDPMLGRFAHTGIVEAVKAVDRRESGGVWYDCATIEGNTSDKGSREGDAVMARERRFYPDAGDRFIRWADLDASHRAAA